MMTIDEAITFCNEKAINIKLKAEPKVFIQIAEWLEELKAYRENSNGYSKEDIELNRKAMYNKALDDLIEAAEKSQYGDVDGKEYVMEHLKALAERLKAGGENEQSI